MNTLNNIHALIDINTETAKNAVIKLSTLMRYLLYETAQGQTSLRKDVDFIVSYISLMKLRFTDNVTVTYEIPKQIPDIQIPAMLFVSFIENAFKHGVSSREASYVDFKILIQNQSICCIIKNSKHSESQQFDKKYSGIGIQNIQKSLDLLFDENYSLEISDNKSDFEVKLIIPYYDNKMHSN